jgi:DNA-binding winged helix-turn-helix (wHTH) protein/TolB-like protein
MTGSVRFGDFEFDPLAGELRRGAETTRLEPQPARVLAWLVERAGEVVSREELQQRVWSGDTFVDFERGLNYCIAQIRAALGDSASEPRFIETLPRRGYRFIAPLQHDVAPARRSRPWHGRAAAAVVLALVLTAGISWTLTARHKASTQTGPPGVDARVRIAVVPFDNETAIAAYDRLAQTLTDATVARLAGHADRLAVVGNAAVLRGPRKFRDVAAIGNALGVSHVILGQVQEIGGQLRITTHLIRVGDQSHVWAHRFEPSAGETPTLDQEVSEAVAAAVTGRLLSR